MQPVHRSVLLSLRKRKIHPVRTAYVFSDMESNLSSISCDTLQQNYHLATFSFSFDYFSIKNCNSLALFKIVTFVTLIVMCKINCLPTEQICQKGLILFLHHNFLLQFPQIELLLCHVDNVCLPTTQHVYRTIVPLQH